MNIVKEWINNFNSINSKVSSPCSQTITTKSLSTRRIITQQGSYEVTLQIQTASEV